MISSSDIKSCMQNSKPVDKNPSKPLDEKNVHGYLPRRCDLECYKCQYQGICIIPRRLLEAGKRFVGNNRFRNMSSNNNKYGFNDFLEIFGYKKRLLRYSVTIRKKKKLYGKD
jgi:hypothetical protein